MDNPHTLAILNHIYFANGSKMILTPGSAGAGTQGKTSHVLERENGLKVDGFWLNEVEFLAPLKYRPEIDKILLRDRTSMKNAIGYYKHFSDYVASFKPSSKSILAFKQFFHEIRWVPYINHQRQAANFRRQLRMKKSLV